MTNHLKGGKLGILVGGGPAPGINGVISSVTIEANAHGMEVIGFQNGFKHLTEGSTTHNRRLFNEEVSASYLRGGSILGTSRTNPAKNPAHMANVLDVLKKMGITCFVTIGGDDTAFSSSQVAARVGPAAPRGDGDSFLRVCHVPRPSTTTSPSPKAPPPSASRPPATWAC